jgi:alcohol dehydrogenase (cytochrome c)
VPSIRDAFRLALLSTAALSSSSAVAQGLFDADATTTPFTLEQAQRGQAVYARTCITCHGTNLEGNQFGPPLTGPDFESHWRGQSRATFTQRIRATMPPRGLGSLSNEAYTDVTAWLVQSNQGRIGTNETSIAPTSVPARTPTPTPVDPPTQTPAATMMTPARLRPDPQQLTARATREAKLASLTPVSQAMLTTPAPSEWLAWRRGTDGQGFSPLKQITRANVKHLRTAWNWTLPESSNEITPLIHDGVLFIASGATVQALEATRGELLWQYTRPLADRFNGGRNARTKTMALHGEHLYVPTADGHVIALETRTGRLVWDQPIIAAESAGLQLNGGPIVANGKIVIGVSLGVQAGGGCYIVGLDAATGHEDWRFQTIARPGSADGDTWNDAPLEERFGAGVWTAGSYDADLNLVYFGVSNTYTSATLLEPRAGSAGVTANDALYTNATIALRPQTGELAWHYQHHRRDVWDLDWVFEQTLVTLPIAGKPRKLVITGGKTAVFDAVDAATGEFVFSQDLGVQNIFLSIDPRTGEKLVNPAIAPEAGVPKLVCPGNFGARNWPATALNPATGVLFVPIIETCSDYTYAPANAAQTAKGGVDMRFVARIPPGSDGNFGRLTAVDLAHRRILWTHRQRAPLASAALATAGGLVFSGDLDRYFTAYDQSNGRVLWRTRLSAAPESFPVTYAVDGRQYVAVVAGSGSVLGALGRGLAPELSVPTNGLTLVVFELP